MDGLQWQRHSAHDAIPHGNVEHGTAHGVDESHGAVRQARGTLRNQQRLNVAGTQLVERQCTERRRREVLAGDGCVILLRGRFPRRRRQRLRIQSSTKLPSWPAHLSPALYFQPTLGFLELGGDLAAQLARDEDMSAALALVVHIGERTNPPAVRGALIDAAIPVRATSEPSQASQ